MHFLDNLRYKIHKTDNKNYIDKKIDQKLLEILQKTVFDFQKEQKKQKFIGKSITQNYFEATFLNPIDSSPIFKDFINESTNNQINFVKEKRIETKNEELITKKNNRSKSFIILSKNSTIKLKKYEYNDIEQSEKSLERIRKPKKIFGFHK